MAGGKKIPLGTNIKNTFCEDKDKGADQDTIGHENCKCSKSAKCYGLFNSPLYTSVIARKYSRYGKILENGTAGSVRKDQDTNRKF